MPNNNVIRLLVARRIPHQVFELSRDKKGALETAQILGVDPFLVYKTIVVMQSGNAKPILAVIPGPNRVDLRLLAVALNVKKVYLPTEKAAEQVTGLLAGGISPLALMNKGFQVIIDAAARNLPEIHISGGERGINIRLPVTALAELTHARFAVVSVPE